MPLLIVLIGVIILIFMIVKTVQYPLGLTL